MMNNKLFLVSMIGLAALGFSATSFAGGPEIQPVDNGSGVIAGVQVGYSETNWDNIHHDIFANFAVAVSDDASVGVRPYIGYAFNRFFALELGYAYLGDVTISRFEPVLPNYTKWTTISTWAFDYALRFNAPFNDYFGVFGRIGEAYLMSEHSINWRTIPFISVTALPPRRHTGNFNVTFGTGLYYNFTPKFRLELGWTRFEGNAELKDSYAPNVDFFSLGLSYRFGNIFN